MQYRIYWDLKYFSVIQKLNMFDALIDFVFPEKSIIHLQENDAF